MADSSNLYQNRMQRTMEASVEPGASPVDRYDFGDHVESAVDLEAIGTTANRNNFQLTFQTVTAAVKFVQAGDFSVKGRQAIECLW